VDCGLGGPQFIPILMYGGTSLSSALATVRANTVRRVNIRADDQPSWARPALVVIAAVAALLYSWNIRHAGLSGFYSVAVKSMSENWKAFIFGAFDPSATITLDKLAGSFAPQAVSVWIFGFHPWSIVLPQVIEGVISVLVIYRAVRRWAGVHAGLFAAGIFALTPVAASMFGHSMEDGALTMCLVLAADAYQRAVGDARLRSLAWCGFWVGVGFQTKMLQAWIVLPALAAGYLFAAPVSLPRRVRHVLVAAAVALAVSLSWIALYTFTPAADRPYIDGSLNNSAITMVFGYNGLERFGVAYPGSVGSMFGGHGHGFGAGGGGWTKLLGTRFGPEIGWLYPLALLALVGGLVWYRRAARTDTFRAGFVMWGVWLLTFGLVFSKMSVIPHTAYVASLAPALAALSGAGIVMFWREYRAGGRRGWLLPTAVAAEVAWAAYLWSPYRSFLPEVAWIVFTLGIVAVAGLVAAPLVSRYAGTRLMAAGISPRTGSRIVATMMIAGVAVMLAAPTAWSASVLDLRYSGSAMNANAGPLNQIGFGRHHFGGGGFGGFGGNGTLTAAQTRLYDYVSAHRDGAPYLMAVTSWSQAAPYIEATGQEVLPMGGFSGTVPSPTLAHIQDLVRTGQLRYFLLTSQHSFGFMRREGKIATEVGAWVRHSCVVVPVTSGLYRCDRG
jgi:4-amino-4-deoxy-L-arabinose transferase-like glycosyltransferase